MTTKEAVQKRHMVRQYLDRAIPAEIAELLRARIAANNKKYNLHLALTVGNSDGISGMAKLLLSKTVNNYIILAGPDTPELDEKLGYCGADLILYAQTLGLNTWWVGGMFNGKGALKNLGNKAVRVNGVIAVVAIIKKLTISRGGSIEMKQKWGLCEPHQGGPPDFGFSVREGGPSFSATSFQWDSDRDCRAEDTVRSFPVPPGSPGQPLHGGSAYCPSQQCLLA